MQIVPFPHSQVESREWIDARAPPCLFVLLILVPRAVESWSPLHPGFDFDFDVDFGFGSVVAVAVQR